MVKESKLTSTLLKKSKFILTEVRHRLATMACPSKLSWPDVNIVKDSTPASQCYTDVIVHQYTPV